jgi:hypothetical protein
MERNVGKMTAEVVSPIGPKFGDAGRRGPLFPLFPVCPFHLGPLGVTQKDKVPSQGVMLAVHIVMAERDEDPTRISRLRERTGVQRTSLLGKDFDIVGG